MDGTATKILILVQNKKNIEEALKHLEKNDFICEITESIQECVMLSLKKKPDYILVSANHQDKKILLLPKLLAQTSKAKLILMAEFLDSKVEGKMSKIPIKDVIYPPLNGPKISRKVKSISLEESRKGQPSDSDSIYVKSSTPLEEEQAIRVTGDITDYTPPSGSSGSDGVNPDLDAKQATAADLLDDIPDIEDDPLGIEAKTNLFDETHTPQAVLKPTETPLPTDVSEHYSKEGYEQLDAAADLALKNSVTPGANGVETEIGQTSNVICLNLDSAQFQGYVLAAVAEAEKYEELLPTIQKRLVAYLFEEGIEVSEEDINDLEIQDVQFLDWAREEAEFLKVADHHGGEVAMAFFRDETKLSTFITSAEEDMVVVSLADISPDEPVQCDVYLHMPVNGRFLLYAKKGQKMVEAQKPRLMKHGVVDLHIRREDIKKFKKYQAKKFFNNKASGF